MMRKDTRARIAATALHLLERGGAGAVSMRKVARLAGISAMAIYHHFPNRRALLRAVTAGEFERLAGSLGRSGAGSEARLLAVVDGYLDYAFGHPHVFDYVFSEPREDARRFPADFRERRSPTLNVVADTLRTAMDSGEIRRGDVWEIALQLWAEVHGYVALHRAGRIALSREELRGLCRRSLRRLLRGLRA